MKKTNFKVYYNINKILITVVFVFMTLLLPTYAYEIEEIYVATNGNDGNIGSFNSPLLTLNAAKQKVRSLDNEKGVKIIFRGGDYYFNKGINFDEKDSGTYENPIIYTSYKDEKVNFLGSKNLQASRFKVVTDKKIIERLPKEAVGKVAVLNLKDMGIKNIQSMEIPQSYGSAVIGYNELFLNGQMQTLARWPNNGFEYLGKVVQVGSKGGSSQQIPTIFKYNSSRQDKWVTAKDAFIQGYFMVDYAYDRIPMLNVDTQKKEITAGRTSVGISEGKRWCACNLLEELDIPGEWYIDREDCKLYFYPPYTLNKADLKISVLREIMFKLENVRNITFENINISQTCNDAFNIVNCENIVIRNCTITDIGKTGVFIDNSKKVVVSQSAFDNIGCNGVSVNGGNLQDLTPGENIITKNIFSKWGRNTRTYTCAVDLFGVGNTIENNIMHDSYHFAIRFSGNDHKIKYNEIYNVLKETLDAGAIYAGRNYTMRGTEISYNYIHDIITDVGNGSGLHAVGVYLDDQYCGTDVHHNVIDNVGMGVLIGGGHDNKIHDNIITNCPGWIHADNRGENWSLKGASPGLTPYDTLNWVPYDKPPYCVKYPELATILDSFPGIPKRTVIKDNLVYNCEEDNIVASVAENGTVENNIKTNDSTIFKNIEKSDYSIKKDSKILEKLPKLKDIDLKQIGFQKDGFTVLDNKPFMKIEPKEGEIDISNFSQKFRWDSVVGADYYNIKIATDRELNDVILEKEINNNYINVPNLPIGKKKLYWNVSAKSYGFGCEKEVLSRGNVYMFTTPLQEKLEKENLEILLNSLKDLDENIVEGEGAYEYKKGTKELLQNVMSKSKPLLLKKYGFQKEVDDLCTDVQAVLDDVKKRVNGGYTGIEHMLRSSEDWICSASLLKISDNELKFTGNKDNNTAAFSKNDITGNEVICFDMKTELNGKWMGFALNQDRPTNLAWVTGANTYMFVIKPDIIEIQKFVNGKANFMKIVPNDYVKDDKWHNFQMGKIDRENGTQVLLKIDGKTVYNDIDTENPLRNSGSFVLYDFTDGKYVSLKKSSIPINDSEIENVIVQENKTQNINSLFDNEGTTKNTLGSNFDVKFDLSKNEVDFNSGAYKIKQNDGILTLERYCDNEKMYLALLDISTKITCMAIKTQTQPSGLNIIIKINDVEVINIVDDNPQIIDGYLKIK